MVITHLLESLLSVECLLRSSETDNTSMCAQKIWSFSAFVTPLTCSSEEETGRINHPKVAQIKPDRFLNFLSGNGARWDNESWVGVMGISLYDDDYVMALIQILFLGFKKKHTVNLKP